MTETDTDPDTDETGDEDGGEPTNRIDDIVEELSVDEKIDLVHGSYDPDERATGYVAANERVGTPSMSLVDGPMGVRAVTATAFPASIALASSWDTDLAADLGGALAREVRGADQDGLLAPGFNIVRVPQCGRAFEYYSEDPTLASRLAVNAVTGVQDNGVLATAKHYVANNQEADRHFVDAQVSERALREIYLPAFEAAVKEADVGSVMAAYNRINGTYAAHHRYLLTEVLKDEWGFDGFVVSDWWATHDGVAAAEGGLDLDMPGLPLYAWHEDTNRILEFVGSLPDEDWIPKRTLAELGTSHWQPPNPNPNILDESPFDEPLRAAVADGRVEEADLDEKVRRVLGQMERFGLFEDDQPEGAIDTPEHRELARQIAERGTVLLDNDGTLPLVDGSGDAGGDHAGPDPGGIGDDPDHAAGLDLLVTGPTADDLDAQFGGWSSTENDAGRTVREAFAAAGADVTYREGAGFRETVDVEAAADGAADADAAVVCVGEPQYIHEFAEDWQGTAVGEFPARSQLSLPPAQRALVAALAETDTPTVVVLISGRPLAVAETAELADAVLFASYPGSQGGRAVAEVVTGAVNPSGALSVSVPRSAAALPSRFNHLKQPDVIGPDFHPDTYDPLYPFGHGLSYTDFEVRDLSLSATTVGPGSVVTAEVAVENVGDRAGALALDCYLTDEHSTRVTPVRELADFTRVDLAPGESTTAAFDVDVSEFGVLGADGRRRVEPGEFTVRVADCEASFSVEDRR